MANAIYMLESSTELLSNASFASNLNNWTDATGSWSWHASGGAQYDNDDEGNPLTQVVTLSAGWHYITRTLSGGYTGTLTVRVADTNGTVVFDNNFSDPYFLVEAAGDFNVVIVATDLIGYLADLSLQTSEYRLPVPNESDIVLDSNEVLGDPKFEFGIDDWASSAGHWVWHSGQKAADYDGSSVSDTLSTNCTVESAWYRLGIVVSSGATGDLEVKVNGVTASIFFLSTGRLESYFKMTAGSATVEVVTDDFVGFLKLVSLKKVLRRDPSLTISRAAGDGSGSDVVFEMRSSYDFVLDAMGAYIGNDAGLNAYTAKRNYALGDEALQYGGTENVGVGSGALKLNEGAHNVGIGYQALRDNTSGAGNIGIGYLALLSNGALDSNIALGNNAGQDATGERCVYIGHGAGQEETTDDTLYIANENTKSLLLGDFVANTLAVGFDDLSRGTSTLDVAAGVSKAALRVRGGVRFKTVLKTAAYTVTVDDILILCDATTAAFTLTLPAASGKDGTNYIVKKIDSSANAITLDGNASETIDGSTTKTLSAQWDAIGIIAHNGAWYVMP
jgi:hypothetical protein